jgi:hypothetical protein
MQVVVTGSFGVPQDDYNRNLVLNLTKLTALKQTERLKAKLWVLPACFVYALTHN